MKTLNIKTYSPKAGDIERSWHLIDAAGQTLGRLSSEIAKLLRGKHKPGYAPHMDTGDFVIVINAEQIVVTGGKAQQKVYNRHSNYPGGFRSVPYLDMLRQHPTRPIEEAVKGMLPRNRLGEQQLRKLHIYAGPNHPHSAQQPTPYIFSERQLGNPQGTERDSRHRSTHADSDSSEKES